MADKSLPLTEKCPLCNRLLIAVRACPGCGDPLPELMLWCCACNQLFEADPVVSVEYEYSPGWPKLKGLGS